MMKTLITCLIVLLPTISFCQKQGKALVDSCIQELRSDRFRREGDSARVRLLVNISHQLSTMNPDSGLKYGLEALKLAERMNWKRGIASACNPLCSNSGSKSDFRNAIVYGQKALAINRELGAKSDMAANLGNIGNCYTALSDHKKALASFFETLKLAEEVKNDQLISLSLLSIGQIYSNLGDNKKSLDYLSKSAALFRRAKDSLNIATALSDIGAVYIEMKDGPRALQYALEALKIFEALDNKFAIMIIANQVGAAFQLQGKYRQALPFWFRALRLNNQMGSQEYLGGILCTIGEGYYQIATNNTDEMLKDSLVPSEKGAILNKAITYLENGIQKCEEVHSVKTLIQMHKILADAYERKGNLAAALRHYKASNAIKDTIFSDDNKLAISTLETKREMELKDKQVEITRLLEKEKKNEQVFFLAGIALLAIVVVVVIRSYYAQSKINKVNIALLNQKDELMKEIHHRVKNNLQVISTLLDLQMNSVSDELARDAMTESATRVKSISLIHQQLYQNENVTIIEFARFTRDLQQQIKSVFKVHGQDISLTANFLETAIDIDTAVPVGLILNELMTNSYKHAFTDSPEGNIEITLEHAEGQYQLTYKDSGPGLPENMDIATLKSLGMKLVGRLTKQIGGKLNYIKADNTFVITFKDTATRKLVD